MNDMTSFYKGQRLLKVKESFSLYVGESLFLILKKDKETYGLFLGRNGLVGKLGLLNMTNYEEAWLIGGRNLSQYDDQERRELKKLKEILISKVGKIHTESALRGKTFHIKLDNSCSFTQEEVKPEVLVVDDSPTYLKLVRKHLEQGLSKRTLYTTSPFEVLELADTPELGLIISDVNMPEIKGTTIIKVLKGKIPIMLMSGEFDKDSPEILSVINQGAIDFIQKEDVKDEHFIDRVKAMLGSHGLKKEYREKKVSSKVLKRNHKYDLMVIGISTGGVQTLEQIFSTMKRVPFPIVVFIHMPEQFTGLFVKRLNETYGPMFEHIENSQTVSRNKIYVGKGNAHFKFSDRKGELFLTVHSEEKVKGFCPNIDFSFQSLASLKRKNIAAGILTGMGKDGAKGLLELKREGATTFAQDEESSIIYGMPKAAHEMNAANIDLNPIQIARWLNDAA